MLKTVIVFDSVGLDIPDYVMTNDDGGRRPAGSFSPSFFLFSLLPTGGSRHTADMVSLIKRWFIYHIAVVIYHISYII